MTTNKQQRLRLHQSLERQIGEEMAGVLMSSLPPFDWNQVATKDDLKVFATRDEMNLKFADMNVRFVELNATTEIGLANLRTEIASHQEKNVASIEGLRADFQKSLRSNTARIMTLMVACFGLLCTYFGVLFSRI